MSDTRTRPTVKIVKPRIQRDGYVGEVVIFIEGLGEQRLRMYVGPGDDIMHVFIKHDETVSVGVEQVPRDSKVLRAP